MAFSLHVCCDHHIEIPLRIMHTHVYTTFQEMSKTLTFMCKFLRDYKQLFAISLCFDLMVNGNYYTF